MGLKDFSGLFYLQIISRFDCKSHHSTGSMWKNENDRLVTGKFVIEETDPDVRYLLEYSTDALCPGGPGGVGSETEDCVVCTMVQETFNQN